MIEAGGNAYYLAKLAGILGLNVQDIGAQQTGMSVDAFKQKLLGRGEAVMAASSEASPLRTFPPSATPSRRSSRTNPTGSRSSTAWPPVREWLGREKPDVIVFFYNDHGLNFFLDKMPTFAVGAAAEYVSEDEGWGIPTIPSIQGRSETVVAHHQRHRRRTVSIRSCARRWRSITPSPIRCC